MTVSISPHARRHPMTVVTQARRFREAGWRPYEIVDLLAQDGVTVDRTTVVRWTDPESAEKHRRRKAEFVRERAAKKSGRAWFGRVPSSEFKFARIRALHEEAGMTCGGIARVMAFDFGDPLTDSQVRYALTIGRYPEQAA